MKSLTILSTVKNIKNTISPWIDSLTGQEYCGQFEIVIIDSLSTDGTKEILNDYSLNNKNIRVIEHASTQPQALNYAIDQGLLTGEYVALIDGDCIAPKNWLSRLVNTLDMNNVDAVGGPGLTPQDTNLLQKIIGYELDTRFMSIREGLVKRNPNMNLLIKRSVLENIRFDENLPIAYDAEFCYRFNKMGYTLWFDPESFVYHYHRSSFGKYVKQQFLNAKYLLKFNVKLKSLSVDNINPSTMMLQPVMFILLILAMLISLIIPQFFLILGLLGLVLVLLFTVDIIKAFKIHRSMAVLFLFFIYLVRLPVWSFGILAGIFS